MEGPAPPPPSLCSSSFGVDFQKNAEILVQLGDVLLCLVDPLKHLLFLLLCREKRKERQYYEHYDVFKDTLIRYLGYANEVGEAFRALVKVRWVWLSYGVASSYVLADAVHKGWKEYQDTQPSSSSEKSGSTVIAFTDTLIWQGLASVVIPGFTINRICHVTGLALRKATSLPSPVRKWGTTAVGLGCIPFIVRPIDRSVDFFMDKSVRTWYKHHPKRE
ncbi:hypothetical protein ACOMHN_014876 [Nucella lapillus]